MGDEKLLRSMDASDWVLGGDDSFLTFFVVCSDDVRTFADLQIRILNAFRGYSDHIATSGHRELLDRQTRRKISLKFFESESTRNYVQEASKLRDEDLSFDEKIKREADLLSLHHQQRVLVIIDELDRLQDSKGLASFIKASSSESLKFVLVGIAQSISDLDLDHPSVERHLVPVRVPRMKKQELLEIIDRAVQVAARSGQCVSFEDNAKGRLATLSGGFPWFVHVIGQAALIAAYEDGESVVSGGHLDLAVQGLIENKFAQHFRDLYQRAVRDSRQREIVIRCFAEWGGQDIPTADTYGWAKNLGVTNPTIYKGHLCSSQYGAPLMVPGFQERGLVRFRNEMFRQYIRLTRSLYPDVDGRVRAVAEDH